MADIEAVLDAALGSLNASAFAWHARAIPEIPATLNRLAGTSKMDAAGAANAWAGTTGRELVGALNAKAGTTGKEFNGVCKELASQLGGDSSLDAQAALDSIP